MAASDPIKTVRRILQAGGRPHMGTGLRRCDKKSGWDLSEVIH
jgi:hypothetical protein